VEETENAIGHHPPAPVEKQGRARKKLATRWSNEKITNNDPRRSRARNRMRACLKIPRDAVFEQSGGWRGATRENTFHGSSTKEQRRQPAVGSQTLRVAGPLAVGCVGSVAIARRMAYGDAPPSPRCLQPKSLAAAPVAILRPAHAHIADLVTFTAFLAEEFLSRL